MDTRGNPLFSEKITIEPDLGDQRRSVYKALPAPPKTPKRMMKKYRFTAVVPLVLVVASFVLTLVVVLAGKEKGTFEKAYVVSLNTSRLGQDIIRFERATSTTAAPSATSSSSTNPLAPLDPFSTESPLNPNNPDSPLSGLGDLLDSLTGNLTDAVNDGLGTLINSVVESVVDRTGISDYYYLYLGTVCSGNLTERSAAGTVIDRCESWREAGDNIAALTNGVSSSIVIGRTNVSVPLVAKLGSSLDSLSGGISSARKAVLAFLIISLIGTVLSAVSMVPAMIFPQSRLLVYLNVVWPSLASTFALLTALILTVAVIGVTSIIGDLGETVGVEMRQGGTVLLFVWLAWVFSLLPSVYWGAVWFVEVRKSGLVRRARREEEMGNWRGIGKEVWGDVRGKKEA